jgi:hypothetical protein
MAVTCIAFNLFEWPMGDGTIEQTWSIGSWPADRRLVG